MNFKTNSYPAHPKSYSETSASQTLQSQKFYLYSSYVSSPHQIQTSPLVTQNESLPHSYMSFHFLPAATSQSHSSAPHNTPTSKSVLFFRPTVRPVRTSGISPSMRSYQRARGTGSYAACLLSSAHRVNCLSVTSVSSELRFAPGLA